MSENEYKDGYNNGYTDGKRGEYGKGSEKNPHTDLDKGMTWDDGYRNGHIAGIHGHDHDYRKKWYLVAFHL